jgi:hypothetical protein
MTTQQHGADMLASACRQQQLLAQANSEAIHAVLSLDTADVDFGRLAAEAVAIGVASLALLHRDFLVAAIDWELAAAGASQKTRESSVRLPSAQLQAYSSTHQAAHAASQALA